MSEIHTIESQELIRHLRTRVNARLQEVARAQRVPETLYEPIQYVLEGNGKRIRPVLLLLVNEAYGGPEDAALDAAVSLEMLHNFTLIHDDIMDDDSQRRGKPTVHTRWNVSTGILSGDGLLAMAYKVLLGVDSSALPEILEYYTDGLIDICEGQAYDKEFETRSDVALEEYLMMIRKKTGRLLSLCCKIGGIIAEAPAEQVRQIEQFGLHLGTAFQVQDDLLELTSTSGVMGKSLGSDFFAEKKTFVVLKALELADKEARRFIREMMKSNTGDMSQLKELKQAIQETGVVELTRDYVATQIRKAKHILDNLPVDVTHLRFLTEQLLNRKS